MNLKWLGYVLWKDDSDWVKRSALYEMDGVSGRGQLKMTWNWVAKIYMRVCGPNKADVQDWIKWRSLVWSSPS